MFCVWMCKTDKLYRGLCVDRTRLVPVFMLSYANGLLSPASYLTDRYVIQLLAMKAINYISTNVKLFLQRCLKKMMKVGSKVILSSMSVWVCPNMVFLIWSDETRVAAEVNTCCSWVPISGVPAVNNSLLLLDLFHPPISPTVYF